MQEFIMSFIENYGYIAVMLLICVENVFPPIPSEVILTFAGFMVSRTNLSIVGLILASTIGALVGAFILYYIGRLLNKERLMKIVSGKIGKILRLKPTDIEKADKWFDKKGNISVLFCRCVPIVRSLISIPAGMSDMKLSRFTLFTLLGTLVWNTVLVVLGSIVGENWVTIASIIEKYSFVTLIILVILFIVGVIIFYKKKNKNR